MDIILIGERIKIFMKIKNIKRTTLAKELGISYNTATKKLNGQREFTLDEILKIKEILNLDKELYSNILFNEKFIIEFE